MLNKPYIHYIDVKIMNNVSSALPHYIRRHFPLYSMQKGDEHNLACNKERERNTHLRVKEAS